MKTRELIHVLVADQVAGSASPEQFIALAVSIGALVSTALFLLLIGFRPDIAMAAFSLRFFTKFMVPLTLAAGATGLTLRLSRPDGASGWWKWVAAAAPLLLVLAVMAELIVSPASQWERQIFGDNWLACLSLIILLSIAPLCGLIIALKQAAPRNPSLTGTMAGLAAGGIAAAIYAAHCTDDSPLFVATWYSLAIGFVALAGMVAGRRLFRW